MQTMSSSEINNKVGMSLMFDAYKDLLTKKQRDYFTLHVNEDYSLNEIADEFKVSKAAVSDSVSKTEKILMNFEDKLKLVKKNTTINELLNEYKDSSDDSVKDILKRLKETM